MILDSTGQKKLLKCTFNSRSPGRGFHHYLMTMRDEFKPFVQFELQDALHKHGIKLIVEAPFAISWDDEAYIDLFVSVINKAGKSVQAITSIPVNNFRWPEYISWEEEDGSDTEIIFKPEDFNG